MRVLGIDPGSLVTGYGVLDGEGNKLTFVACGGIKTRPDDPLADRLKVIYEGLLEVIETHKPDTAAVESIFHAHNVQSALKLGHARGVAMLAAVNHGLEISEYLPMEVKKSVCSFGHADKEQVQRSVHMLLRFQAQKGYDATDALAVAICHLYSSRLKFKVKASIG